MAGHKRKGEDMPMINRYDLEKIINSYNSIRDRAIVSFLYLTGARVSEALSVKADQLKFEEKYGKKFLMIYNVQTLKRRKPMKRAIAILLPNEQKFVDYILEWINHNDMTNKERVIFISKEGRLLSRCRIWQILKKKGLFPHYMRHLRMTHLVQDYSFASHELKEFAGWSTSKMGEQYIHLTGDAIVRKMALEK